MMSRKRCWSRFVMALLTVSMIGLTPTATRAEAQRSTATVELRDRAVRTLRDVMGSGPYFANVHAAEMLLALDYPEGVREAFEREVNRQPEGSMQYVAACRVLARAAPRPEQREPWVGKILAVFLDGNGTARLGAAESLGKLGYYPPPEVKERFESAARSPDDVLAAFARWVMLNSGSAEDEASIAELLRSPAEQARANAANALRFRRRLTPGVYQRVVEAAAAEPAGSAVRVYLISAAYVHAPNEPARSAYEPALLAYAQSGNSDEKLEAFQALATIGTTTQLPLLEAALSDPEPDARCGAAHAVLRIERRTASALGLLDWLVIAGYGLGMLAIGIYYSWRTNTSEEYLLGGRRMNSWAIGISLFATLLSTISYLAYPGEMIKYGPMILAGYLATPFVFFVAGWWLIPYIMRLKVTSAYEILELRLGVSVRLVAASLFLAMRMLWMGVIIYTTTDTVLIPLMGLDPKYSPLVAGILGIVTLVYTSMGGLQAVVVTDVVQTFILFAGAIFSLVLITFAVGGVANWFPTSWDPGWAAPRFWFNSTSRITFAGAMMGGFLWWICTCGSDQMAIQRYLSTRDAKAARRSLLVTLVSDTVVTLFLSTLGFALLAYFRAKPHMLPDGQSLASSADQLFPRYIAIGLPVGVSGLAVAGLLAAGMSSLSSGINSSCTVIKVDFLDRFRRKAAAATHEVRRARIISVIIGVIVVLISSTVNHIPGNLMEAISKLFGLFVAPLFLLFFMAMFVPWATSFGTLLGTACAVAVAAAIAFYSVFGLSFVWIMPCSLFVGLIVASLASLLPVGRDPNRLKPISSIRDEAAVPLETP